MKIFERLIFVANDAIFIRKLILLVLLIIGNFLSIFFLYNTIIIVESLNLSYPIGGLFLYILFFVSIVLYFISYLLFYIYALTIGYRENRKVTKEEVKMNLLCFLRLNAIIIPSYFSSDEEFKESKVQKTKNFFKKVNIHLRVSKEKRTKIPRYKNKK